MDAFMNTRDPQVFQWTAGALFLVPAIICFLDPALVEATVFREPALNQLTELQLKWVACALLITGAHLTAAWMDHRAYSYVSLCTMPFIFFAYQYYSKEALLSDNGLIIPITLALVCMCCTVCSLSKLLRYTKPMATNNLTQLHYFIFVNLFFMRGFWSIKSPDLINELLFTSEPLTEESSFIICAYGFAQLLLFVAVVMGRLEGNARLFVSIACLFTGWWQSQATVKYGDVPVWFKYDMLANLVVGSLGMFVTIGPGQPRPQPAAASASGAASSSAKTAAPTRKTKTR